jgi:hypothetical protein
VVVAGCVGSAQPTSDVATPLASTAFMPHPLRLYLPHPRVVSRPRPRSCRATEVAWKDLLQPLPRPLLLLVQPPADATGAPGNSLGPTMMARRSRRAAMRAVTQVVCALGGVTDVTNERRPKKVEGFCVSEILGGWYRGSSYSLPPLQLLLFFRFSSRLHRKGQGVSLSVSWSLVAHAHPPSVRRCHPPHHRAHTPTRRPRVSSPSVSCGSSSPRTAGSWGRCG